MPIHRRATSLIVCVLALSCRRGSGSSPSDGIQVLDVDAPIGLDGPAISRCDRDGSSCKDLGKGDKVAPGTLITSARGARAWLGSDAATSVDIAEDTAVFFDAARNIELRRGGMVVRRLGNAQKSEPLRIDVAGRTGEIDPQVGANVVVRARSAERAGITVEKGKLTLKADNGQTMVLLSGESAELAKGRPPERTASFVTVEPHHRITTTPSEPPLIAQAEPRGLGRMTARIPGQNDVVSGVRLVSHHVEAVVRDGLARTEVEEVFYNDTSRVLEGRYVFPLPADASISRLALWVNDKPVEGEIVEKKRAAAIFKEIVDDTVRPRDPALLEWVAGSDFSLKIFPLPAKGSRKVRIAYDQVVKDSGGRIRYSYPLSVGAERATTIDDFSMQVRVTDTRAPIEELETPGYATSKSGEDRGARVAFSAKQFVPAHDFVVSYARPTQDEADLAAYVPSWGELKGVGLDGAARGADATGYVALRLRADLPLGMTPAHVRRDRAIIVDASHSQSKETLDGEAKLAAGLIRQLDADERFVVLACDSACTAYPASGLASPSEEHVAELEKWLAARSPSGSSDLAGALMDAARRLEADGSAQIVYVGDGSPSSGELSADRIAARVGPLLRSRKVDLRFLGAGRAVDEIVVGSLAQDLGATYEPVTTGESLDRRIADLSMALRSPVIRGATIDVPSSFVDVYPKTLRNLRLGEQVVLVGRLLAPESGLVRLRGEIAGETYTLTRPVRWTAEANRQNPLVPRLWSLAKIADLESATDAATVKQIVDMSKRYHVMSRYTSLLVLENDQMFAEYGIKRTAPATAGLPADEMPAIGANPGAPLGAAASQRARESDDRNKGEAAQKKTDSFDEEKSRTAPAKPKSASAPGNPYDDSSGAPAPAPVATMAPMPVSPPPGAAPAAPAPRRAVERPMEPSSEAEVSRRAGRLSETPTPAGPRDDRAQGGIGLSGTGEGGSGSGLGGLVIATPGNSGPGSLDRATGDLGSFGAGHGLGMPFNGGATAQLGPIQVTGDLPAAVVERILRQRLGMFRNCYQLGLATVPSLTGRVNARFVIGQNGEVISTMNGGDNLSNSTVVNCILSTLRGLHFPAPGSGYVTVAVPVLLRSADRPAPMAYRPPQPSATHRAQDEAWRSAGDDALAKLRTDVANNPASRRKYEDLVRGLLSRGRFEEALERAKKFVELDPDLAVARELLAYAAVTNDDPQLAVLSVDTQTETEPTSLKWHIRGARAFEAMGDERRACAHWRTLAELSPQSDEYLYESLRCRARVFDDGEAALSDARRVMKPGKLLSELIPALEGGRPPAFAKSAAGAGQLEADFTCSSGDRCPSVFIVSPIGNVFSPFTPTDSRSSAKSVAVAGLRDGTYTTLLAGGSPDARGEIELRAFGSIKKFPIGHGGTQTVAATKVTFPRAVGPMPIAAGGDGFLIAR